MESIFIKNIELVDYNKRLNGNLLIKNGIINYFGETLPLSLPGGCRVIEGQGLIAMPAFTDLHCHFRDPGYTYKEDIHTGSMAAVKGGFTAVNLMANTKPVCSSMEIVDYVLKKAKEVGLVDIHQVVSITKDFDGHSLEHLDCLKPYVKYISEDGFGIDRDAVMLKAMLKAKKLGIGIMAHCENKELSIYDTVLSEDVETIRNIALAKYTGCKLHICHVSTEYSINEISKAKAVGFPITCEVTPHHIALDNSISYKVNPPLRSRKNVTALIEAIKHGTVDAIATDHAPHTQEDKKSGSPGMVGLETAFQVCYTELVKKGYISLNILSSLMSRNPSRILGLNKGTFDIGTEGDVVLLNLNKENRVDPSQFSSKGKNTPFEERMYFGEVAATIKGGRIVYMKEGYRL